MEQWLLATADADETSGTAVAAWVAVVVALVLAGLGRRRWPPGVGEGLFVGGLSGLLLLNYVVWGEPAAPTPLLSAGLVSLAVLWLIVAVWIERGAPSVRSALAAHAAAVSGLLVVPAVITDDEPIGPLGLAVRWLLLLGVAGGLYLRRREALTCSAALAVAIAGPLWLLRNQAPTVVREALPTVALLGGAVSLVIAIGVVVNDWRRRVRAWRIDPRRLLTPAPGHRYVFGAVVAGCVLTGAAGVVCVDSAVVPLGVILAGYAALVVGHRWCSNVVGAIGLTLVGEALVLGATAWLPRGPANPLLGFALAGVFLLWLARFWTQQLCDGRPWTTTGRLIPAARNLSLLAVGGQVLAAAWLAGTASAVTAGVWSLSGALLLMLLHAAALVREAQRRGCAATALAACVVLVAAVAPADQLTVALQRPVPPVLWLALAAVVLALRAGLRRPDAADTWALDAYLGALLPLAVLFAVVTPAGGAHGIVAPVAAIVGVAMAMICRFARRLPTSDIPATSA